MGLGLIKYDPRLLLAKAVSALSESWTAAETEHYRDELLELGNQTLVETGDLERLMREPDFFQSSLDKLVNICNLGLEKLSGQSLELAVQNFRKLGFRRLHELGLREIEQRWRRADAIRNSTVEISNRTGRVSVEIFPELEEKVYNDILSLARKEEELDSAEKLKRADQILTMAENFLALVKKLPWKKVPTILVGPDSIHKDVMTTCRLIGSLAVDFYTGGGFSQEILLVKREKLEQFLNGLYQFASGRLDFGELLQGKAKCLGKSVDYDKLPGQLAVALALPDLALTEKLVREKFLHHLDAHLNVACNYPDERDEDIAPTALDFLHRLLVLFFLDLSAEEWPEIAQSENEQEEQRLAEQLGSFSDEELLELFRDEPMLRLDILRHCAQKNAVPTAYELLLENVAFDDQRYGITVAGWLQQLDFRFAKKVLRLWEESFRNHDKPEDREEFMNGQVHERTLADIISALNPERRKQVLADFKRYLRPRSK